MNPLEFIVANAKYMANTLTGSFRDTVSAKQPRINDDEMIADLHAHPYISSADNLHQTLDILVKNNVDLLALTIHGKGDFREFDFWKVKGLIEKRNLEEGLGYVDKGDSFQLNHKGKTLTFIAGYEVYVSVDGIKGRIDIISLMPDKGFEKVIREGLTFEEYLQINKDHDAIVIAAHPYTIWDPYGLNGFFKFRLATGEDRKRIRETVFPKVHGVDLVATNAAWMVRSNELLQQDYPRKPLANSDAHSPYNYTRKEIGRSGNIFELRLNNKSNLKYLLRESITLGNFRTYLNYTPPLQFLLAIAFDKPPNGFP